MALLISSRVLLDRIAHGSELKLPPKAGVFLRPSGWEDAQFDKDVTPALPSRPHSNQRSWTIKELEQTPETVFQDVLAMVLRRLVEQRIGNAVTALALRTNGYY